MIGTTLSHYKILEKLGEGGMGVVYKAQDTTLDRLVALKFLPAHLSASEQDKARFVQEARAAAALNHPNICTIYGIEEHDAQVFIAMEFVEGQTLRDKGLSIPLKQAIEIGMQLADGLGAAHEKGIVHRDVKPENIMIQKDGRVRIMDFGLAKLKSASRLTKVGSTVGTTGYMSPEQVQGLESDHRSDIFSLGVILYELFSGQSPFKGAHETAINYEIVNVDPDPIASVKPEIAPELDAMVLECLEKEPAERYQSVAEITKELRRFKRESSRSRVSRVTSTRAAYVPGSSSVASIQNLDVTSNFIDRLRNSPMLWMAATVLFFATTVALVLVPNLLTPSKSNQVIRAFIPEPDKFNFSRNLGGGHLAVSPDGLTIAFAAVDSANRPFLWVRPLNALSATMLAGTQGASFPFWSPDNRYIGFFAGGKLKKIEATGGPPFSICDVVTPRGGSWGRDGKIVLPLDQLVGLSIVSDAGGTPTSLTTLDTTRSEQTHRYPFFLPDGKHFVYMARTTASGSGSALDAICVASVDGKMNKRLLPGVSNVAYAGGHLLYMRDYTLMAHPFDPDKMELTGDPFPIAESVDFSTRFSVATFAVSQTGVLVYLGKTQSSTPELALVSPLGKKIKAFGQPEIFVTAALSNNRKQIALDLYEVSARNADIWLMDIERGVKTRFTFDGAVDAYPIWSPDGNRIVFSSNRKGHGDLYEKMTNGAADEQPIAASGLNKIPSDWSRDGKFILFQSQGDPKTKTDLWMMPATGDRKPVSLLATEFDESIARFSPDTKWISYQSNESGRTEVYVRPFPGPGAKWQVSTNGGTNARWRENGKEIFYFNGGKVMVAEVNGSGTAFTVGKVREFFDPSIANAVNRTGGGGAVLDISDDGQKILLTISTGIQSSERLTLVANWPEELKKK